MEVQAPVVKKRVIKIKKSSKISTEPVNVVDQTQTPEQSTEKISVETSDEKEQISIIPSSRIKNYISKEKLNKELDTLIDSIKTSKDNVDLSKVLNEEYQKKVGALIKEKEQKNEEIQLNSIVIDVLSKHKYKFSSNSFKVLSVFLDLMIEEITLHAMNELVKNKKSIINLKYIFNNENTSGDLYGIYSKLSTYINEKKAQSSTETVESTEPSEPTEASEETTEQATGETTESESVETKSINFEFYIRKICNKLKVSSEDFAKIKVSEKYQKFCSNLLLDFLDNVVPLTKILLEVMTTKTITDLVFETIIKIQLYDNSKLDSLLSELHKRLKN